MTYIPNVDLSKVATRCAKKKCRTKDFVLHRHHKGHQYLFVACFIWRLEQPKYRDFVKRYYRYEPEDTVKICSCHHREIHERYDRIIERYVKKRNKALSNFSWAEAEELMSLLVASCNDWLGKQTKGSRTPWPSNGQTKRNSKDFLAVLEHYAPSKPEDLSDIPF